jgi:hypothetical protein
MLPQLRSNRSASLLLLAIALACAGGCQSEGTALAAAESSATSNPENTEEGATASASWFEVEGSRSLAVRPASVGWSRLADLPLFEDDTEGFLLYLRQADVPRSKAARIELFPLPVVPGTYEITAASTLGEGQVAASVVLPKQDEKVFLPMAIYGETVSGTLQLQRASDGALEGTVTLRAQLSARTDEPFVKVEAAFQDLRLPGAP